MTIGCERWVGDNWERPPQPREVIVQRLRSAGADHQDFAAKRTKLRIASLHLAEVRLASDSGEVAKEDHHQRTAQKLRQAHRCAVGPGQLEIGDFLSHLQGHAFLG